MRVFHFAVAMCAIFGTERKIPQIAIFKYHLGSAWQALQKGAVGGVWLDLSAVFHRVGIALMIYHVSVCIPTLCLGKRSHRQRKFPVMDVELLQDGAAPGPEDSGAVLGVLRAVGLVGPKLALQLGEEDQLARQLAERAGLAYGDWIRDLIANLVRDGGGCEPPAQVLGTPSSSPPPIHHSFLLLKVDHPW